MHRIMTTSLSLQFAAAMLLTMLSIVTALDARSGIDGLGIAGDLRSGTRVVTLPGL